MKKFKVILGILLILAIAGCQTVEGYPENGQNQESAVDRTTVILRADLSHVMNRGLGDYYVVYVDLTDNDHPLSHERIESERIELSLRKGHVYVAGVFEQTEEGIVLVGLIGNEEAGLSSLPITNDATDVIDLGTLEASGGILSGTIPIESFARMLGFADEESIRQFGGYDMTLKNLLNPDIDGNGVFDDEEGIRWMEKTFYDYTVEDLKDFDSPSNPENYLVKPPSIIIWLNYKGHDLEWQLYNSTPYATLVTPNGEEVLPHNSAGSENGDRTYMFSLPSFEDLNGEYTLIIHDNTQGKDIQLRFNWAFLNPRNQINGMLFPVNKTMAYSDGVLMEERIKWFFARNYGGIEQADDDIIKLIGRDILICFWEDVGDVPILYFPNASSLEREENGVYTLEFPQGAWWQLRTFLFKVMRMDYSDIAGNEFVIRGPVEHEEFPSGYGELEDWEDVSSPESIFGVWYNHGFIRDNDHYTVLVFQPDGRLEAFNTWREVLWSKLDPTRVFSYSLNEGRITIGDNEASSTCMIREAEAGDGRRFIKLECGDETLVYTNFYSYINAYGRILQASGYNYAKLKSVKIDSFENNVLSWSIDWDGEYKMGVVGFDFYVGDSPNNLKLAYFQYEDYEHMRDRRFSRNLRDLLELEPGTYYVKIVANSWKEVVESDVVEVEVR